MSELPPLWAHQKQAIEKARGKAFFALLCDPGTGKSRALIEILRERFNQERKILRTLILCPSSVVTNWRVELLKYSKLQPHQICLLTGTGKKRTKALIETKAPILVSNFEAVLIEPLYRELQKWGAEVCVWDELHRLKNSSAKTTKACTFLADGAALAYGLTGTPILNSPMDLFAEFRAIDKGRTLGKNFFAFRAMYFIDKNASFKAKAHYFPNWVLRQGALEEITKLIEPHVMQARKEDCLDLPPFVRTEIQVELSPQQRKHYEELKRDFVTYVNDAACVTTLAITKALRMQQCVSGFLPVVGEPGEEAKVIRFDNPRLDVLREMLENLTPNHKILVWAVFHQDYAAIRSVCESLNIQYVEMHGEVSDSKKREAVEKFNTDPLVRLYLGNPNSGGIGVNLIESDISIYYSRNFSLGADIQSEARNYRGGSEKHKSITRYDLVAVDTIDEHIKKMLASKQAVGDKVLRDLASGL